jgi:putative pyruvate formate lyase activating enzyme
VLADLKFGCCECAARIADAADYCEVVMDTIAQAAAWSDVIVRHRVLPDHFECCTRPGLEQLAKLKQRVKVSLWFDYIPPIPAKESLRVMSAPNSVKKQFNGHNDCN